MQIGQRIPSILAALVVLAVAPAELAAQVLLHADPAKSEMHIELGKAGLLRALGDDHLIRVRNYSCEAFFDERAPQRSWVKLMARADSLEVADPKLAADKRAQVQAKMESSEVLDVAHHAEITFVSKRVVPAGKEHFRVEGDLKVRDATRPVSFEVTLAREAATWRATGEARFKLTDFGIDPPSAGGGTVKVKDELKISFQLVLLPAH